jgi:hypothetical protein
MCDVPSTAVIIIIIIIVVQCINASGVSLYSIVRFFVELKPRVSVSGYMRLYKI